MPNNVFQVAIAGIVMVTMMTILGPIVKAWARRLERRGQDATPSPEIETRLARIENAIESIAIEVERISEGQRFTTKLLSEQKSVPASGTERR